MVTTLFPYPTLPSMSDAISFDDETRNDTTFTCMVWWVVWGRSRAAFVDNVLVRRIGDMDTEDSPSSIAASFPLSKSSLSGVFEYRLSHLDVVFIELWSNADVKQILDASWSWRDGSACRKEHLRPRRPESVYGIAGAVNFRAFVYVGMGWVSVCEGLIT